MLKKITVISGVIGLTSNVLMPISLENNNNYETLSISKQPKDSDNSILDFNELMLEAFKTSYMINYPEEGQKIDSVANFKINNLKQDNMDVTPNGDPDKIIDPTFNYIGENTFINNTNEEQTFSTSMYSKELSSTINHSINKGISFDISKVLKIFGIKISFSFNKATTGEIDKTTKDIYTVPSQNIKVKAHKKAKVQIYWSQITVTQNVSLKLDLYGSISGFIHLKDGWADQYSISIGDAIQYLKLAGKCDETITFLSHSSIHFSGIAKSWTFGAGSDFKVIVTDIE